MGTEQTKAAKNSFCALTKGILKIAQKLAAIAPNPDEEVGVTACGLPGRYRRVIYGASEAEQFVEIRQQQLAGVRRIHPDSAIVAVSVNVDGTAGMLAVVDEPILQKMKLATKS